MKKSLYLSIFCCVTIISLSSCFRFGYLRKEYMTGFSDSSLRHAQFYIDRKMMLKGDLKGAQNIVENGKVTIVQSKKKDKLKIRKFTKGEVLNWDKIHDELTVTFGNSFNMKFHSEPDKKRGDRIYQMQLTEVKPIGKKDKYVGYDKVDDRDIKVIYRTRKHTFRHGKIAQKPSLMIRKKVKKVHHKSNETATGVKVS